MSDSLPVLVQFVIDQMRQSLSASQASDVHIRKSLTPEILAKTIDLQIKKEGERNEKLIEILKEVIDYSVNTNHPFFMNQMFGKTQPIATLADILISLLNTSMYTYEVAPVLTLIEKETISKLASYIWGEGNGDGVFTSGGSISNMKAMFLARQNKLTQVKNKGLSNEKPIAIFISEQAHYSFIKGVNFMGFGTETLFKIPSKKDAKIDLKTLEKSIDLAKKEGRLPLMLIAIAGTTISGTYDDISSMAKIAKENNMWFHVDAAFGGALLFSEKEKHKLKGIEQADSVTWNFHKVMGMPLSTSTFLTKEKGDLNTAFNVDADYLFHDYDYDYDLGQKSLQGGRRPEAMKLWLSMKYEGEIGFSNRIDKLRNITQIFTYLIKQNSRFELFQEPESIIVCFRYILKNQSDKEINDFNKKLREDIFNEGKIIFNYATLNGKIYLRCVLLDPDFTEELLTKILETIVAKAENILLSPKIF